MITFICYAMSAYFIGYKINGGKMINQIFKNWRSPFITRDQLYEVTGGLIHPRTIRNLDSLGQGIKGKFFVGRKVAYPVEEVINFLEGRFHLDFNPKK